MSDDTGLWVVFETETYLVTEDGRYRKVDSGRLRVSDFFPDKDAAYKRAKELAERNSVVQVGFIPMTHVETFQSRDDVIGGLKEWGSLNPSRLLPRSWLEAR